MSFEKLQAFVAHSPVLSLLLVGLTGSDSVEGGVRMRTDVQGPEAHETEWQAAPDRVRAHSNQVQNRRIDAQTQQCLEQLAATRQLRHPVGAEAIEDEQRDGERAEAHERYDAADAELLIVDGAVSPIDTIRAYLQAGYAGGAWNGSGGIKSASAAAEPASF